MKVKQYSDITKYPKLFKDTYWGNFKASENTKIDDIVINRNQFVDEFEILKCLKAQRPINAPSIFDHCELYKNANKLIYITSPYGEHDQYEELAERIGFTLYKKLYSPTAVTYYKFFTTKTEFNRVFRQWEKDFK